MPGTPEINAADGVFINCPFDADFAPIFDALVFTVLACGFQVRTARELEDGGEARLDKLFRIIEESRYGIHDLSRTELGANGLPRFNMPFELGLFLAARRFGGDAHRSKRTLVLDVAAYRYQQFISDLNGIDPQAHGGSVVNAIEIVRNWLANVSRRKIAGPRVIIDAHTRFEQDRPAIAEALGFDPAAIPYFDFVEMIAAWLVQPARA